MGHGEGIATVISDSVGTLPDADSDELLVGCRKPKNVDKFF